QMMGCVPLDPNARPLRTAIIWADQRAVAEAGWVGARISFEEIYRITGHRLSSSYSLEKILWVRNHQPEIARQTYKYTHAKDAIVARLTGAFVTDPSDASGMNLYDLHTGSWSQRILTAADLDPAQLPEIWPSSAVVGEVSALVADEVGVPAGTPVVIGGGDGACAAAGAGVVAEGSAYNYVGSSSWIALATEAPIYDPDYKTFTFAHLVPGMFMPDGTMQAAGASYQWMRDQLCPFEVQAADTMHISPYELMNAQAADSPPGANGLLFLPYLMGERSPHWNPKARGAFVGLTIRHTRADVIRAVMEGVALNLRVILDAFTTQGAKVDAVRLIGGGARGQLWNQIMADVYGVPVQRLAVLEAATSMGAALTGGVGVGLYPDFSMAETMNPVVATIDPDPAAQRVYAATLPLFRQAYEALVPVYDGLAALEH
ncbi:MAG: FGGY-family carbohydrate kinase, partial [Anaerolineae bacterium]|nr:FGGY-family carbohydrate kinase [Anaerolineae bacterium]